jgi:hypothetical protein
MVPYYLPRMAGMLMRIGLHRKMADGFQDEFTRKAKQIENRITFRLLTVIDNISQSGCQGSYYVDSGFGLRADG